MTRAVVIFTGVGSHPLAKWLKPGFRHCAVAVQDGDSPWILIDPAEGVPNFRIMGAHDFDLAAFYREIGETVVETVVKAEPLQWPLAMANCAGMVKAVLGLRAPLVVTPYALYRRLTR
jgi:hypothetical protein